MLAPAYFYPSLYCKTLEYLVYSSLYFVYSLQIDSTLLCSLWLAPCRCHGGDSNILYLYKTPLSLKVIVWKAAASKHELDRFCSWRTLLVGVVLPWLCDGPLSWEGFVVQVGHDLLHPGIWRPGTQLTTCHCLQPEHTHTWTRRSGSVRSCVGAVMLVTYFSFYLQDGRVGATLAGPDVAGHSFFRHRAVIETKAAFPGASTTHTYKQTCVSEQLSSCNRLRDIVCFFFFCSLFNFLLVCMRLNLMAFFFLVEDTVLLLSCSIVTWKNSDVCYSCLDYVKTASIKELRC